jgi:hypothetical protein
MPDGIVQIEDYAGPPSALWIDDDVWTEADRTSTALGSPRIRTARCGDRRVRAAFGNEVGWGVSVALGQPHGRFRPIAAGNAIVYNVEDNKIEQRRRLSAVLRQFDAIPADIRGRLIRVGPSSIGTLFKKNAAGDLVSTPAMNALRELIRERSPAIVVADPLAELHDCEENDNQALRAVIAEFRTIAVEFDLAVILIHHTRKGDVAPGDPDTARGASAIIGAARTVLTVTPMSEKDADEMALPKDRKSRSAYVRLDDAKANYSGIGDPVWYEKVLYTLDNREVVPAAVPWDAPDMWQSIPVSVANTILDRIEAGNDKGQRYSDGSAATERAAWKVVVAAAPSLTEDQARKVIKTWTEKGVLFSDDFDDPVERKKRKGLFLNPAKRPGNR